MIITVCPLSIRLRRLVSTGLFQFAIPVRYPLQHWFRPAGLQSGDGLRHRANVLGADAAAPPISTLGNESFAASAKYWGAAL